MHKLILGWRNSSLNTAPYLYHDDMELIEALGPKLVSRHRTPKEYLSSDQFGNANDKTLHLGLLPQPYMGNLEHAKVFILMLNPGFSSGDYFAEERARHRQAFRSALIKTIRQENGRDPFPFIYLNPDFAWHPGFDYFHKRLTKLAREVQSKMHGTYTDALQVLSRRIAILELVPYHSHSFGVGRLLSKLPSTQAMLDYVWSTVVPKAREDMITIIVSRSVKHWAIEADENVQLFQGSETRSGYLTPNSHQKILKRIIET